MFAAARPSASRLVASSSSFRSIASSSRALAAAKGKPAKSGVPAKKKAANTSFSKKPAAAPGGGGGGGGGGNKGGISLVYSEARPVADLGDWPKLFPEITEPSHVGKPTTFAAETFTTIKQFGLPRRIEKELSDASGPASVIRQCTVDLAKRLDGVRDGSGGKSSSLAITGERGAGKSMLLLQTVAHALNSGWIVLYVPRCSEWINSSSAYNYHPPSSTFHQPALAASLLSKLLAVNAERLEGMVISQTHKVDGEADVEKGTKLVDFIRLGMRADVPKASVGVLEGVMAELSSQSDTPFLIALDEVQSLYTRTQYLTPTAAPLETYHLTVPRLFLSYISSASSIPQSGKCLTLSAMSYSTPSVPPTQTFLTALAQPTSSRNPVHAYTKLEPVHLENAKGVETFAVQGLGGKEAGGIMEIYAKKGWSVKGDETYLTSLISSGGNAMEFGRGLGRSLSVAA